MTASADCNGGQHAMCPGYFRMTHACSCACHQTPATAVVVHNELRAVEETLAALPASIEAALAANAFRAGAIDAHLRRVGTLISDLRRKVTPAADGPEVTA